MERTLARHINPFILLSKRNIISLILLVLLAAIILAASLFLPVKALVTALLKWIQGLGIWGAVLVGSVYIPACVLFIPGSILTLAAGFLFGVARGMVTVVTGSTLGACAAFLVGRTLARDWVAQMVASNRKFAAIDHAVGRQGFKIVLLTRLCPIFPFNLLNYAFGLTKVRFVGYAFGSLIGMLPGTLMYVWFGAGLRSVAQVAADDVDTGTAGTVFFWAGLAMAVLVMAVITRIARNALRKTVGQQVTETDLPQPIRRIESLKHKRDQNG